MKPFIAIDFETSGLDPNRHAPVSLGATLFVDGLPIDNRQWIIKPHEYKGKISREYDVVALSVSGISWKSILGGAPAQVVLKELEEFVSKIHPKYVVAFNASFDHAFYSTLRYLAGAWCNERNSFSRYRPVLPCSWVCSMEEAESKLHINKHSLDSVAEHFGLTRSSSLHGAKEDSDLAGRIHVLLNQSVAVTP